MPFWSECGKNFRTWYTMRKFALYFPHITTFFNQILERFFLGVWFFFCNLQLIFLIAICSLLSNDLRNFSLLAMHCWHSGFLDTNYVILSHNIIQEIRNMSLTLLPFLDIRSTCWQPLPLHWMYLVILTDCDKYDFAFVNRVLPLGLGFKAYWNTVLLLTIVPGELQDLGFTSLCYKIFLHAVVHYKKLLFI